jgi:hypothetical protein
MVFMGGILGVTVAGIVITFVLVDRIWKHKVRKSPPDNQPQPAEIDSELDFDD